MKKTFTDIRSILAIPATYRLFSKLIGFDHSRSECVEKYVRPKKGYKILDIGCGPGCILEYLQEVEYIGFDMSQNYIDDAKKRFGNRGTFLCKNVTRHAIQETQVFDIVLAIGVIHHLNDTEALQLFELAQSALKPLGRLVTFDNCYVEDQSKIARYLISLDRGKYVRKKEDYLNIASKVFSDIKVNIRYDLLRVPYTHVIMECTA